MSGNQMNVQWNNHLQSLGTAFPRMFSGQRFVDVTLVCEGRRIHCHRVVLAVCSAYFEILLDENPAQHPIIILPKDVKFWALQALVEFMYRGEVNVSENGLQELLRCAEVLQIQSLTNAYASAGINSQESRTAAMSQDGGMTSGYQDEMRIDYSATNSAFGDSFPTESECKPQPKLVEMRDFPKHPRSMPKIVPRKKVRSDGSGQSSSSTVIRSPPVLMKAPKTIRSFEAHDLEENIAGTSSSASMNDPESAEDVGGPLVPPEDFVLPNYSRRSFSRKDMWRAMMSVKAGKSIKEAAKTYKIPTPSLHHYTKRFGIHSPFSSATGTRHKSIQKKRLHHRKDQK